MKFPIDLPPAKQALGIAVIAVAAYLIVEGTGVGVAPKQFVSAITSQIKNFFSKV